MKRELRSTTGASQPCTLGRAVAAGGSGWVEVHPPVTRSDSLRARLSQAAWSSGIETFFVHAIPFSYSTGKAFACRIARLMAFALHRCCERRAAPPLFHVYEIGAGLGVLALHVLDLLREHHPDLYSRLLFHVTDASASTLERIQSLGVLDDHREHVRFEVVDALRPKFGHGEEPAFVLQSYMVDSLPARHIEISSGEVFELLVRTRIPRSARLVDTSVFPPRVVEAKTVVAGVLAGAAGRWRSLLSQVGQQLHEEYVRVPIRESGGMSHNERVQLEAFAATLDPETDTAIRFNYCYPYTRGLRELLSSLGRDALVVIHDFGWVDRRSAPEPGALSTSYGATICHGVSFPYLVYAAEQAGATCRCTENEEGESQVLLIDKGDVDDDLAALFCKTFENVGYESVRDALRRCTEIADTEEGFADAVSAIISSLAEPDRHDYALLLGITWELLRRGFPRQAIGVAEQSLDGYRQVAVDSYLLLGLAHLKLDELGLAEGYLRKALAICPHYPVAHAELGHVLLRQGRQEEHLEAALESLRGYPDDSVWEQVVVVVIGLLVQGRTDEARSALTSILETAEHHATLVPDFVVQKLHSLQRLLFSSSATPAPAALL